MSSPALNPRPRIGVDLRAVVGSLTGIGRFTLSLLRGLVARESADYVGMAHRWPVARDELADAGVTLERQAAPYGLIWQQLVVPRRLKRGGIDLFWSPLLTLPPRLAVPGVVTVHDLTPVLIPETHRLKVLISTLPFLRPTLERAAAVAVDSLSTATDLRAHFPDCADRVQVVYPGVDPDFVPGDTETIARTRKTLDHPEGYLLYVGTLEPRKNLSLLLDAWELLRDRRSEVLPLVIAGPYGWRSRSLLRRIERRLDQGLHYLGPLPREELVRVVQASSVFVYPSLHEGFGLPPAEAMACGVPTVVSDCSSLPEVVGDAGCRVDPSDPEDLAATLSDLLEHPAKAASLGEKGRIRAGRFSWSRAAEEMEAIFLEALRLQ